MEKKNRKLSQQNFSSFPPDRKEDSHLALRASVANRLWLEGFLF